MLRTFALLSLLFHGLFSAYAWNPTYVERLKALQKNGLPYFYNDAVENEINVLLNNEDSRTAFLIGKSQYFFGAIEKELDAQNLPRFLKYIPFANTSMSMNQVAPDGATGPWPLQYTIAKKYSLMVNSYVDQRRSTASHAAAAHYLSDLFQIYRDWKMVIAAFRCGPVELNKSIRFCGNQLSYDSIHNCLPEQFQSSMVKYMAVLYVWTHYTDHGIRPIEYSPMAADSAWSNTIIPFDLLAAKTGASLDDLRFLNPELKLENVPYLNKPYPFLLPKGFGAAYETQKEQIRIEADKQRSTWQIPMLEPVSADSTAETDSSVNSSDTAIAGVTVTAGDDDDSVMTAVGKVPVLGGNKNTPVKPAPKPAVSTGTVWVYYTIKKGDGFWTLADVFDCTISDVKKWNGLGSKLYVGRKLKFKVRADKVALYKSINKMTQAQKQKQAAKD